MRIIKNRMTDIYIKYGDFHVHTNYTDGKNTVYDYCKKAKENNLKSIAFTEHVRKKTTYNFNDLLHDIFQCKKKFKNIKILSGCETKVLDINGGLDASKEVLDKCDIVTGVFHEYKYKDKKKYLTALKSMLSNPIVNIWGHPTLFAKKHNIKLNDNELDDIIDICINNNILIEKNIKYKVPDIAFIKYSLNKGAKFVIGSDAHNISELLTIQKLKEEWKCINKTY